MPRYEYKCGVCGHREDQVRHMDRRDDKALCPVCPTVAPGPEGACNALKPAFLERDVIAGMTAHTDLEYHTPILSNAAGINPSQIAEAKRLFPHHEYAPDGRMIFRSHQARERALKDIGFHDNN